MWDKIKAFFKRSETIFIARLQYVVGFIILIITTLDPQLLASYIPTEYVPLWLIFVGIVTEIARRRNAKDLGK